MTEKINIKGQEIWIVIDPHVKQTAAGEPEEYFTASYHAVDPATEPGGTIFLDTDQRPVEFRSPVEALEYAQEKLLDIQ